MNAVPTRKKPSTCPFLQESDAQEMLVYVNRHEGGSSEREESTDKGFLPITNLSRTEQVPGRGERTQPNPGAGSSPGRKNPAACLQEGIVKEEDNDGAQRVDPGRHLPEVSKALGVALGHGATHQQSRDGPQAIAEIDRRLSSPSVAVSDDFGRDGVEQRRCAERDAEDGISGDGHGHGRRSCNDDGADEAAKGWHEQEPPSSSSPSCGHPSAKRPTIGGGGGGDEPAHVLDASHGRGDRAPVRAAPDEVDQLGEVDDRHGEDDPEGFGVEMRNRLLVRIDHLGFSGAHVRLSEVFHHELVGLGRFDGRDVGRTSLGSVVCFLFGGRKRCASDELQTFPNTCTPKGRRKPLDSEWEASVFGRLLAAQVNHLEATRQTARFHGPLEPGCRSYPLFP